MKSKVRKKLLEDRNAIPLVKKKEASSQACSFFLTYTESFNTVVSFAAMDQEINLDSLNKLLAQQKKLILPRISHDHLKLYKVEQLKTLVGHTLRQPDPNLCEEVFLKDVDLILVPGVGFDHDLNRIGYGKGFYDKLLEHFSGHSVGVCFKKQVVEKLPTDSFDQKVGELFAF